MRKSLVGVQMNKPPFAAPGLASFIPSNAFRPTSLNS